MNSLEVTIYNGFVLSLITGDRPQETTEALKKHWTAFSPSFRKNVQEQLDLTISARQDENELIHPSWISFAEFLRNKSNNDSPLWSGVGFIEFLTLKGVRRYA